MAVLPKREVRTRRPSRRWPLLFLLLPFAGLLYVPLYDRVDPTLGGIPFFVWYQFAWVVAGSVCTWLAYRLRD
jgi:Protein of unknown function (DUF3311)